MDKNKRREGESLNRREFLKVAGMTAGAIGASHLFPHTHLYAATPKAGGTLKASPVGFTVIRSLDPALCAWLAEQQIEGTMFNSLVRFDADMNIVPDLAQSWTMDNDLVYRFKLFSGIKFHDGEDCTAKDVVYSLERVRNPATGSPHRDKYSEVDQIKALDKLTVEIRTKRPFAPLLSYLCNARTGSQIVSKKAVEKYGADYGKSRILPNPGRCPVI